MAITDDLRKTLSDPTPLYFAAGTAELAVQQALRLPALLDQIRAEAPARVQAVRESDPKEIQDRAVARAREAQAVARAAVTEVVSAFSSRESREAELRRLQESAQGIALRGFGLAAEYAVRARETYEKVAERGEEAVRGWRGEEGKGYGQEDGTATKTRSGDDDGAPAPGAPRVAVDPEPDGPIDRAEPFDRGEPFDRAESAEPTGPVEPVEPVVVTKPAPGAAAETAAAEAAADAAPEAAPAPAEEPPAPRKAAPRRAARPAAKPAARKPAAKKPAATPPARKSAEETPAPTRAETPEGRDEAGSAGGARE
ncbi:hypothetical protein [Streptomyces sp. NRRL F-5630]|uniref:hypothetical protein n=1 Tax=Streptomyces sp. NRRL F-5630 TaxID=1463864 RepID=UPI003EBD5F9E